MIRLSLTLLAAIAVCAAAEAPVIRPHHVVVSLSSSDDAQSLQKLFTEDLGLPELWPVQKLGGRESGAVFLGNFSLELAVWPQVEPLQFLGLALEARDTASAYAEVRSRGLRIKEVGNMGTVSELAGEGLGIFLCHYDAVWMAPRLEQARKVFAATKGGKAGVVGVEAIEIGMNRERREALVKLIAPAQPESWDPPLTISEGRYQVRAVRVKCSDPEKAKAILPAGLPIVFVR